MAAGRWAHGASCWDRPPPGLEEPRLLPPVSEGGGAGRLQWPQLGLVHGRRVLAAYLGLAGSGAGVARPGESQPLPVAVVVRFLLPVVPAGVMRT